MSTEVALREPQRVALSSEQLAYISSTEFVPGGLRGNLPAIMACVATGRALGIDDMSALRLIHVVNGRPTFSAELMVQIVRRKGHSIMGEFGEGSCTVTGRRADNDDTMTVTWTLAMAERAGLANKQTWKAYPEALLWARAASQLCRMLFADCFAGATYTPEELDGDVTDSVAVEGGETAGVDVPPQGVPSGSAEGTTLPGEAEPLPAAPDRLTDAQHKMIERLLNVLALDRDGFKAQVGVDHMTDITKAEASKLIEQLKELEAAADAQLPEALRP